MLIMPLLASIALPYALVLMTPGPNLLIVLRAAVNPSWHRSFSVAAGVASGAAIACFLAAIGASTLDTVNGLDLWGSALLSTILLYSAWRLIRRPEGRPSSHTPTPETLSLRLFSLRLATALSNPLSIPFFVCFYLAEPDFRTVLGRGVVCCVIFLMALTWFTAVGRLFSSSAIQSTGVKWRERAR